MSWFSDLVDTTTKNMGVPIKNPGQIFDEARSGSFPDAMKDLANQGGLLGGGLAALGLSATTPFGLPTVLGTAYGINSQNPPPNPQGASQSQNSGGISSLSPNINNRNSDNSASDALMTQLKNNRNIYNSFELDANGNPVSPKNSGGPSTPNASTANASSMGTNSLTKMGS